MIPALLVWLSLLVTAVALAVLHRRQRREPPAPPAADDEPHLTTS